MRDLEESLNRAGPLKSEQGARYTQALFHEFRRDAVQPSYTTKDYDLETSEGTLYSLKKLYMECLDPTEQEFVDLCFDGDWKHWRRIKGNDLLVTALEYNTWEEELSVRLRSLGIKSVIQEARTGKNSFTAAKWLAEGGWKSKRGRPSKDEREGWRKQDEYLQDDFAADFERLKDLDASSQNQ